MLKCVNTTLPLPRQPARIMSRLGAGGLSADNSESASSSSYRSAESLTEEEESSFYFSCCSSDVDNDNTGTIN